MEKDPRFQQAAPVSNDTDAAAARRRHRPRTRLRPRHRHHRPVPERCRRCSTAARSATVFIDDRSYAVKLVSTTNPINDPTDLENIFLKTTRRPLRAGVDHRHADRARGAAVAVARAAACAPWPSPPACRRTSRSATALTRGRGRSPRRCCRAGSRVIPLAEAATLGENNERHADDLRLRHRHHPAGAGRAVRELRQRHHHHGDGAARARLRGLRAAAHRHQPQRLQPDRPGAAGRRHGQERHPDRRIRQPAARPRAGRARGDRAGVQHPAAAR